MPIRLRFVQGTGIVSRLIMAQEKTAMPFTPSHVEAVTPDGLHLGAHVDGGVLKRQPGYDGGDLAHELFLDLAATDAQHDAFYSFLDAHIGEPYDWRAIVGFIVPDHEHIKDHVICSALMALALRNMRAPWFPFPLAAPAHLIDPRDLLLMLSGMLQVPM